MHKLLARQLRAAARKDGEGVDVDALIAIIDQAYEEFDRERRLNDRAAKLMEDELREANDQARREHDAVLATILSRASDGMLVTCDGLVKTANKAAELQFGAAPGGLAGQSVGKLMGLAAQAAARDGVLSDDPGSREASAYALDGRAFPVEFSVSVLEASGDRQHLWIVRDISERIRSQREIVESRLRFQDFAEASSDCFWEMEPSLSYAKTHASGESGTSEYLASLLTPDLDGGTPEGVDPGAWAALRSNMTARQHFRDLRFVVTPALRETLHLSLSGKPVFDLEGQFRGYRGTARDITREVVAREAARRAERRMVEAMDAAPNAIALVDSSLDFVAGNSALKELVATHSKYLQPGQPFANYLARALQTDGTLEGGMTPTELLRALIATEVHREMQVGGLWLLVAARRLSDEGAVVTFSDVTTLKQRERELAEAKRAAESASRLKSQFLATMSHELRTPLNAILGFSEVIQDRVFGNSEETWNNYAQYAGSIHASGKHLLSLISEILDLSKIEAGSYTLDLEVLDLRDSVTGALNLIAPAARNAAVEIVSTIPDTPFMISGDGRSLRQIALNLLSNSVKFTPTGGTVHVELKNVGETIELTISDTGIGIAAEHLESVFEPFRQVDASIRRRHEGTGLGLAITKRLVEMHCGTIRLESESGTGTIVQVRLPACETDKAVLPVREEAA